MVEAEVGGQRVAGMRLSERMGGFVCHLLNNGHGGELVAGDGGIADARGVGKHAVHVFRQAVAVDHREEPGFVAVHVQRNDDVAYGVLGCATVRIVVPVGIEMKCRDRTFRCFLRWKSCGFRSWRHRCWYRTPGLP